MDRRKDVSLYDRIGGAEGVRRLVETFYDLIEEEPAAAPVNILHLRGHGIAHSRIEQFNFLSGFLGGPNLYAQKYGHSNVRKMHEHVEIGAEARDAWLSCMSMALDRCKIDVEAREAIMDHFKTIAGTLQNRD